MTEEEFANLTLEEGTDLDYLIPNPYGFFPQNFMYPRNTLTQNIPIAIAQNPAMVDYGIMGTDQANNFQFQTSAYEDDEEGDIEALKEKPSGIAKLFQTLLGFAIPGYGLLRSIGGRGSEYLSGGLESLRGLNQRIQQSDFGRSPTLMDYFDARSYGGRDARDRAAGKTMRAARAIQKQMDMRPSSIGDISIDRGRGISQELRDTRQRDLTGGPGKDYGPFSR
jgi:hypothetical protein